MVSPKSLGDPCSYTDHEPMNIYNRSQMFEAKKNMKINIARRALQEKEMKDVTF